MAAAIAASTAGSTSGSAASVSLFSGARSTTVASACNRRAQAGGQHLLQLGEGAGAGELVIPASPVAAAEPDRHGDGLLVVEQEGRQLAAGSEPVAAGGTRASHRRGSRASRRRSMSLRMVRVRDPEAGGELGARPVGPATAAGRAVRAVGRRFRTWGNDLILIRNETSPNRAHSVGDHDHDNTQTDIRPFRVDVAQADLDDLMERLARTRLPQPAPADDWSDRHAELVPARRRRAVAHRFDWRAQEARINAVPHFTTEIDGQTIHFIHVRSRARRSDAAAAGAHLPRLVDRLPRHDRRAGGPGRPRRPRRGRVRRRDPGRARATASRTRSPRPDGRPPASRRRTTSSCAASDTTSTASTARTTERSSPASSACSTPRASSACTCCSCSRSRRATRRSSSGSSRRTTPGSSTCSGSSRSAATTR